MHLLAILATVLSLAIAPADAGVVVSVWSPGVVVFDPYEPSYVPGPRPEYIWIAGGYDEYGYYIPGYWQPVAPNPGYVWAAGWWSGRVYYEGYWRPVSRPGRAWIEGYYVNGRYTSSRWVHESEAAHARAEAREHVRAQPPPERAERSPESSGHEPAARSEDREPAATPAPTPTKARRPAADRGASKTTKKAKKAKKK
ncbi:MAG: hypothetical protein Q8P41_28225 [Pseudomonadota bacterium]|nr:hypothetical protein [Pseudomonadota bacterium]